MEKLIVAQGIAAFERGDFAQAIEFFERASQFLGSKTFEANIAICQKRLQRQRTAISRLTEETTPSEMSLGRNPVWHRFAVAPGESIQVFALVRANQVAKKAAVALIRFLNEKGQPVTDEPVDLPKSEAFGTNFVYLPTSSRDSQELFSVKVPRSAATLELGVSLFFPPPNLELRISELRIEKARPKEVSGRSTIAAVSEKTPAEFKVALIADEFTYNSFKEEFVAIPIEPDTWKKQFKEHRPDVLFCESAWSGPDPVRRPWRAQIYASKNFAWENRTKLLAILRHCREIGIPTIFWNKEDPSHYEDRVNDFVKTATEFDYVFTSAEECVARYKSDYGLKNVYSLPFATNPRLFNPIVNTERSRKIVFAGSWYATHADRCVVMESIFDRLIAQGFELEIYDRYYGSDDPNRKWPARFVDFIKPNVSHEKIAAVYKSSHYGLNFNTVTDSTTMFARRVFELASCNTLVISNSSVGVERIFGDLVVIAERDENRLSTLTQSEMEAMRESALHLVLKEHTYARRWEQILDNIGIKHKKVELSLTVICHIHSRREAVSGISWFQQHAPSLRNANLLLLVGEDVKDIEVAPIYEEFNRLGVCVTSVSHAKKYALEGKYGPVCSPYLLIINQYVPPPVEWIEKAILHLQYMTDKFIAPSGLRKAKYTFGDYGDDVFLLGRQELAAKLIAEIGQKHEVYYV